MPGKLGMATVIGLGLVGVTSAQAEEIKLDELLVTAGRVPVEAEKVGRSYSVITGEELERRQIRYIDDALRTLPGISVQRSGTTGSLTQVRMRGGESKHVLVMIDGVEVSSISHGSYDFGALETAGIERIEVLRGPQSSLWGSHAMSGVINIITKTGKRDGKPKLKVNVEGGTELSGLTSATLSGGKDRYDYAFTTAWHQTEGINTSQKGNEKDKSENLTVNARVNYDLTEDLKLNTALRYVYSRADTDAYSGGPIDNNGTFTRTYEYYGSVGLTHSMFDGKFVQKANLKYSGSDNRGKSYRISSKTYSRYGNEAGRLRLNYQGTLFFDTPSLGDAKHSLTGMFEWGQDKYRNPFKTDPRRTRDITSFVAEYRGEFIDNLFLNAALRHDIHSDNDNATTFNVNGAYLFRETGTRLHASVGTGMSIPTFFQLYDSTYGNKNLTPEENIGWDVGLEQSLFDDRFVVDVTYFNSRLTDEIVWAPAGYSNKVGKSKRQGVEVSATAKVTDTFNINASYTYTDSKNPDGSVEVRRPKHSGAIKLSKSFMDGQVNTFIDANFVADRYDGGVKLGDYALVNIGADYKLSEQTNIYGRVNNLFDTDYEAIKGYNTQGVTGYVGVRHTF